MCDLPLCTPKINPTISGEITHGRDQVLITPVSVGFLPAIFFKSRSSTYGPFLDDQELLPVFWSDNYISLMPGETRTLTVSVPNYRHRAAVEIHGEAWNVPAW